MKECLSPLPGAPNVGEWYVQRHSTLKKVRTLGAREHSLHLSRGLVRDLAKHVNGVTKSLPRFRPPCGVTLYSCLSDRLHYVDYSTSVELVLLGGFMEASGFSPFLRRPRASLYSRSVLLPCSLGRKGHHIGDAFGAQMRSSLFVVLVYKGDSTIVLTASWGHQVTSPSSGCAAPVLFQ